MKPILTALALLAFAAAQDEVSVLLQRLGSEKPQEREAAADELARRGRAVRAAVVEALGNKDPEIAGRARRILERIDSDVMSLRDFFERALAEEQSSVHRFLRRAYQWTEQALPKKDWDLLLAALQEQKITATEVWERDGFTTYRFLVKKDAWTFSGGPKADLLLELNVVRTISAGQRTKGTVRSAEALLRSTVRAPYEAAIKDARFGVGTVFHEALKGITSERDDPSLPVLDAVEATYKPINDRWRDSVPFGFFLHVEFTDHAEAPVRTSRKYLSIESRLDPPRARDGAPLAGTLQTEDTLGAFRGWGGNGSSPSGRGLKRIDLPSTREPYFFMGYSKEIQPKAWGLADIEALPDGLKTLRIEGDFVSAKDLESFGRFKELRELHLCRSKVGDAHLASLGALPALEHLCTGADQVTEAGFKMLGQLVRLRRLYLTRAPLLTDDGLRHLGSLKGLEALELTGCPKVTDVGMEHVAGLKELVDLELWMHSRITDSGFAHLGKLEKLRSLRFFEMNALTSKGVAVLAKMPSLRELYINYSPVDDAWLAEIGKIRDLEFLAYYQSRKDGQLTDAGLLHLKGLTNLRRLNLYSEKLTDAGMKALEESLPGKYVRY